MEGNIKFLSNYFDKELIFLSKSNSFKVFLLENNLSKESVLLETDSIDREINIFFISKNAKIYIVKPGDTIESICLKNNISIENFIKKNKVDQFFLGQQLNI